MRYEVRDVQTLVGKLVDDGVADPRAIGSTGISYGGGNSMMLAFLRNRIRTTSGGYAPWRSPKGTPISLTAAWPRWGWTNGESIFARNGRAAWSRTPVGVSAQAYGGAIFAVAFGGFVAPTGGQLSADLTRWKAQLDAGAVGSGIRPTLDNAYRYHGVAGVPGRPAPLLVQSGWTDALFPVPQALGGYDAVRRREPARPDRPAAGGPRPRPGRQPPRRRRRVRPRRRGLPATRGCRAAAPSRARGRSPRTP